MRDRALEDASHIDPLRPFFNQLKADECAFAGTGADFADFLPGGFAGKVRIPERPCAALDGTRGVDGTLATLRIKKCAVAVRKLRQRNSPTGNSRVKKPNFAYGFAEIFRDLKEFFFAGPHNSRRACTAISALRTGKLEAVAIPWAGLAWWSLFRTGRFRPGQLRRLFFGHDTILVV